MKTLADHQTERERLRAIQAREDYAAALAATCPQEDLLADGGAVRQVLLDAIDSAEGILLQAIEGERDETRLHYQMSEAVHHLLAGIGEKCAQAAARLPWLGEAIKRGVKPRALLTVSQWAEKYRELKTGTNSPGRWNNLLTPYLVEIMDSLSEHSAVRQVTFIKSSGVGGTEALYNWIGYVMHHLQNKDLLAVIPTLELRARSFNPRLNKMISETPALADMVSTASRSRANREDLLEYCAHARIIKAGANSPDSLRSDHLPYVICDEVDAFPWDVGGEGDPMTLIENRQRTYSRAKTYLVSTPTRADASRIDQQYQRSDRRRYHVPCPHCHETQPLEFGGADKPYGLKWRLTPALDGEEVGEGGRKQVAEAWYVCKHCAAVIDEGHKTDMLAAGRWMAERPNIKHHRGYHLNALYAPVGLGLNWKAVAQKWVDAQGDTAELKSFVNTYLGEVWKEPGDSIEGLSLISRLEAYPARDKLPILLVTAFTDVQKDRIETTIVGWGAGEEAWTLAHHITPADTARVEQWAEDLDAIHAEHGVKHAGIDAGYNTDAVFAYCRTRRYCTPTKGMDGWRPIVEDEKKRKQRLRVKRKKGMPTEPLGTWTAKSLVYSRLKLTHPGPGYIHFPRAEAGAAGDFDEEYFAQLAAEKLVTKLKGHRPFQEWVQTRPRNEALDCFVGNLAVMRLSGVNLEPGKPAAGQTPRPARPGTKNQNRGSFASPKDVWGDQ